MILTSTLTYGQNKVKGHFVSNFAMAGWFDTQIQLNDDSTFKYQLIGDLFYDLTQGTYTIDKDTIKLAFDKEPLFDTLRISGDSTVIIPLPNNPATANRPNNLLFKNRKLFKIGDNGQVIKKYQGFSKMRQFIFFGHKRMKYRKFYLEKVDYEWKNY